MNPNKVMTIPPRCVMPKSDSRPIRWRVSIVSLARPLCRLAKAGGQAQVTGMTPTVEAIYEGGKLLLPQPLALPDKSHVRVTIESDSERGAWLKLSESALMKTWDNADDDVFNELLAE
jgi:predicted DNA-binding antitoxin AbrB/MazE fold protein